MYETGILQLIKTHNSSHVSENTFVFREREIAFQNRFEANRKLSKNDVHR